MPENSDAVTLTHPDHGGSFTARGDAVEHWLARGWQRVTGSDKPAKSVPPAPADGSTPATGDTTTIKEA